ncbi:MAG: hypothetical protein IPL96_17795 [Holophagaceae bacterium]|nr:hypothetical protein [Holophagaceae bacterium]
MKPSCWISAGLLLLPAGRRRRAGCGPGAAGGGAGAGGSRKAQAPGKGRRRPLLVDETPIQTAKALAALPMAAEEQAFALQAVQLANHEVDIAFADVLCRAVDRPLRPRRRPRAFTAKAQAEASLRTEQAALAALEAELMKAREAARADLEDRITVQKAQVDLAKDELEDAEADLEKAGLDPQAAASSASSRPTRRRSRCRPSTRRPWRCPSRCRRAAWWRATGAGACCTARR